MWFAKKKEEKLSDDTIRKMIVSYTQLVNEINTEMSNALDHLAVPYSNVINREQVVKYSSMARDVIHHVVGPDVPHSLYRVHPTPVTNKIYDMVDAAVKDSDMVLSCVTYHDEMPYRSFAFPKEWEQLCPELCHSLKNGYVISKGIMNRIRMVHNRMIASGAMYFDPTEYHDLDVVDSMNFALYVYERHTRYILSKYKTVQFQAGDGNMYIIVTGA